MIIFRIPLRLNTINRVDDSGDLFHGDRGKLLRRTANESARLRMKQMTSGISSVINYARLGEY